MAHGGRGAVTIGNVLQTDCPTGVNTVQRFLQDKGTFSLADATNR